MKKILLALTIIAVITSVASASVLVTANPIGQGKWGWLAAGQYDSNAGLSATQIGAGGYVGYGVMDKLDVYAKIG